MRVAIGAALVPAVPRVAVPDVGDKGVDTVALAAAVFAVDVMEVGDLSCRFVAGARDHLAVRAHLQVDALGAVAVGLVGLLPHCRVALEGVGVSKTPLDLIATAGEIARDRGGRAVLEHVNLARVAATLPMVWTHPERRGPGSLAAEHVDVEIELLDVVHVERALRHLCREALGTAVAFDNHRRGIPFTHLRHILHSR